MAKWRAQRQTPQGGSAGGQAASARLEDAHFAHLTATRAAADNVKDSLAVALAAAEDAKKFREKWAENKTPVTRAQLEELEK